MTVDTILCGERPLRVGFMLNKSGGSLLGVTNYYHNLLLAIAKSSRIQPVLITAGELPPPICDGLPPLEVLISPFGGVSGSLNIARRVAKRLIDRDLVLEQVLQRNDIDVFSHSGPFGQKFRVATTPWIADFQHTKLPEFFSDSEVVQRNEYFRRCARDATLIIVSSQNARNDLAAFVPQYADKARVLPFVSPVHEVSETAESIMQRYKLHEPYFFLPNQFWKHKNHRVVIEALGLARQRGTPLTVIATGHTADRRHLEYFKDLQKLVSDTGCGQDFRALGVIPYADVAALMCHAMAVINPSFFEGWSTSVEEAKSRGKAVILSDIAVHREQAPARGHFFDPKFPGQLLEQMLGVRSAYSPEAETHHRAEAKARLPDRLAKFRETFEDIAFEAREKNAARWNKVGS